MAKIAMVVPTTSSTGWLLPSTTYNSQGVLITKTNIDLISLCYPSTTYTLNSDMKIKGVWVKFSTSAGNARYAVATNNTFTFVSGSTNNLTVSFLFNFTIFGSTFSFTINGAMDLAAKTINVDYVQHTTSLYSISGFDIEGYVNT